jgi:hypothetical protein
MQLLWVTESYSYLGSTLTTGYQEAARDITHLKSATPAHSVAKIIATKKASLYWLKGRQTSK